MSDWIDFSQWPDCPQLERPGYVFEVTNAQGLTLLTGCIVPLEVPFDWLSPPLRFRVVEEAVPQHSAPLPPPGQGG